MAAWLLRNEIRTIMAHALIEDDGAHKADEVFFSWRGDRLYELSVAWLHPLNAWGNSSLNPYGIGDYSRDATPRCLECHHTWLDQIANRHLQRGQARWQRHLERYGRALLRATQVPQPG